MIVENNSCNAFIEQFCENGCNKTNGHFDIFDRYAISVSAFGHLEVSEMANYFHFCDCFEKNKYGTLLMKFVDAMFGLSKFNLLAIFEPMLVKYLLNKLLMLPAPVTVSVSFDVSSGICLRLMRDFINCLHFSIVFYVMFDFTNCFLEIRLFSQFFNVSELASICFVLVR